MKNIGGSIQLAATDVASLSSCAHLVALEVDVLNRKRVRPQTYSSVTQRLMYLGDEHEKRYLAKLRAEGNAVEDLPAKISDDDATAKTLDVMRRGAASTSSTKASCAATGGSGAPTSSLRSHIRASSATTHTK